MGNDNSRLKGLVLDKRAIEVTEFWTLNDAQLPTTSNEDGVQYLSIFQEELHVEGKLWAKQSPLSRVINNLKIYRHPYILKYVNTWEQGGQKHLATERVRPLTNVLKTLSDLQICIGLRTILCALIFLIEKAAARHLNISLEGIYITDNGAWRLAGFEYVWKTGEVSEVLLKLLSVYRHETSVDVKELQNLDSRATIEQYAFANLCEDIFRHCKAAKDNVLQHIEEFREYCVTELKHENAQLRPKLTDILQHSYFNNELVLIHSFLFELPAKSVLEKQNFFKNLIERLRNFNENTIGKHLGSDLISHMLLLDSTAQLCVTPYVMRTKNSDAHALFTIPAYKRYLLPHIKKMFRMRDAQIRLIMLEYFLEYVRLLNEDELREYILPNLAAGMNDVNDVLVFKTMHCLADLVPILGAITVVGEPRLRLFADGRPQANTTHWIEPRSITPVIEGCENEFMVSNSPITSTTEKLSQLSPAVSFPSLTELDKDSSDADIIIDKPVLEPQQEIIDKTDMPPRMSPDGGEDEICKNLIINDIPTVTTFLKENTKETHRVLDEIETMDEEQWSDWETDDKPRHEDMQGESQRAKSSENGPNLKTIKSQTKFINDDLKAFDLQIKKKSQNQQELQGGEEFDFFKDMEPTIKFQTKDNILIQSEENTKIDAKRFAINQQNTHNGINIIENEDSGDGWGLDDIDVDVNVL